MAVIVADGTITRALISLGVSGPSAPSITARAVATGWATPNVCWIRRSSSCSSASPVRTRVAWASVLRASPSGNSSTKSGADAHHTATGRGGAHRAPPRPTSRALVRHS